MDAEAKELAQSEVQRAAHRIDQELARIVPIVESFARRLSDGQLEDRQGLENALLQSFRDHPGLFEIGVAYRPFAFRPELRLFAPHYGMRNSEEGLFRVEDAYDYTHSDWFKDTLARGPHWVEPYFGSATKTFVVGYGVPFYSPRDSSTPKGVVRINLSLEDIRAMVTALDLGRSGYGFLTSQKGVFVAHPIQDYPNQGRTIFDEAASHGDRAWQDVAARVTRGESGIVSQTDKFTGQGSWIAFEPIATTGWSLGTVIFKEEHTVGHRIVRRRLIDISLAGLVCLTCMVALCFRAQQGQVRGLWRTALGVSALLWLEIIIVWHLADTLEDRDRYGAIDVITGLEGLDSFLSRHAAQQASHGDPPIYVRTGVFVQSIEFASANNVIVTGYLWQRYPREVPEAIARGFVLPEAESSEVEQAYQRKEETGTVIGWSYRATLRQHFDYSKYPLDRNTVWLRIWHKDFDKNVVLVPDFRAYDFINPVFLPGIEQEEFVLPGWTIARSYFNYRLNSYNTNFGIDDYHGQRNFPELYFNVDLRRKFIDPFVSNIIPLGGVAVILFVVMLFKTKRKDRTEWLGFTALDVVAICTALFFTVVVAHVSLRSDLHAAVIVYLEYFYLVMYLIILCVSVNALLFAGNASIRLVQYEDNLVPKLGYWPVLSGLVLAVTLVVFY